MTSLRDTLDDLGKSADARAGRVYAAVRGVVTQIEGFANSQQLGRVKARYAGQNDNEESDWLSPLWPGSLECLPRKGDNVLVVFEDGDPHRGYYAWHPTSNTKNRPSEWAVLGTTACGIVNNLVDQVKTMKTIINQLVVDVGAIDTMINTTGLAVSGALAKAASPVPQTSSSDNDPDPAKCQKADGSTVSSVTLDSKALSGNVKVGP